MIFSGTTFCGMKHSADVTPTNINGIKSVLLSGGCFGKLFITRDTSFLYTSDPLGIWNYDTILYAPLIEDLHAGNINYSAQQVSHIRIKRRRVGTRNWITIDQVEIKSIEDFNFYRFDKHARAAEYEYCLIPVVAGIEGNINISKIKSAFEGIYIVDKDNVFGTVLDISMPSVSRIKPSSVIETKGSKFPFVVSNGEVCYDRGTLSALFLEQDLGGEWRTKDNSEYRKRITDFLTNGQPKILKTDDGRCWLVRVVDEVVNAEGGHVDKIAISFSWVQVGNDESSNDLYYNNLSDVNIEGV